MQSPPVTKKRRIETHVDVELASLGRLESALSTAAKILQEENDFTCVRRMVFDLLLKNRYSSDENDASSSIVIAQFHLRNETDDANETGDPFGYGDDSFIERGYSSEGENSSNCSSGGGSICDGTTEEDSLSMEHLWTRFKRLHKYLFHARHEASTGVQRSFEKLLDAANDEESLRWLMNRVAKFMNAMTRYRMDLTQAERQRLDTMTRLFVYVSSSSDVSFDSTMYWHVMLFFQWFRLMTLFPIEHDADVMNFVWMPDRNVVRIFADRNVMLDHIRISRSSFALQRSADAVAKDTINIESIQSTDEPEPFALSNDEITINYKSRLPSVAVDVILKNSATDAALDDRGGHKSSSRRRTTAATLTTTTTATPQIMTAEQRRVLDTIASIVKNGNGDVSKRVLVDGVAGAGKTFMLSELLRSFGRIRYLVKKRSFVDATNKRFERCDNLYAQTIDAYLMRHMNIRSLPMWLRQKAANLNDLKRRLCDRPIPCDDDELVFVDEYSLIERSLAELLDVALKKRSVVLVGDCNQQPAIGDTTDQPVRTMLSYEHVCFMYDNVRTQDVDLLQRLSRFSSRLEDASFQALRGLPAKRSIDMSEFFASIREFGLVTRTLRLLPRIIVVSNERVNYLNWAIGNMIYRNTSKGARRGKCMVYKRKVVASRNAMRALAIMEHRRHSDERERALFDDDAFADEQYVLVGMRYRMVKAIASWPAQIGSRVIITKIISKNEIELCTDDDRKSVFTVRRMRIKPYEYSSKWNRLGGVNDGGNDGVNDGDDECNDATIYMFPFVMDAATTVYQVQGLTLDAETYARCYIDMQGINEKALYVTLSRFQRDDQIRGVANCQTV